MREIATETIIKIVAVIVVGTILLGVLNSNAVKNAISGGITTNINKAAGMSDEEIPAIEPSGNN